MDFRFKSGTGTAMIAVPAHGRVSIVRAEAAIKGIGYGSLISASSS